MHIGINFKMQTCDFIYQTPKPLYTLCIEYIASRLYMIESLVGFPEIVGREIFKVAKDSNNTDLCCFKTSSNNSRCVEMFFDAYGDGDILRGLSLNKAHVFLNEVIDDCWWIFRCLIHLDLSSCGIGDEHDALILLNGIQRLETLALRDNLLTNEGVRKLTVRSRMFQKGFSALKFLDISSNPGVTSRVVSFFRCLPSLVLLNVSNTSITMKDTVLLDNWLVYTRQGTCCCVTSRFVVKTEGWAADLLENWKLEYDTSRRTSPAASGHSQRFYSRLKSRTLSQAPKLAASMCEPLHTNIPPLILVSHLFSCHHDFQPENTPSFQSNPQHKINLTLLTQDSLDHNVKGQQSCTVIHKLEGSTNAEYYHEESLLAQYKCSPTKKKLKMASMLQQLEDFT